MKGSQLGPAFIALLLALAPRLFLPLPPAAAQQQPAGGAAALNPECDAVLSPSNPQLTPLDSTDIQLRWTDTSHGTCPIVVAASGFRTVVPPGVTAYTVTGLAPNTEYCFAIDADRYLSPNASAPLQYPYCAATPAATSSLPNPQPLSAASPPEPAAASANAPATGAPNPVPQGGSSNAAPAPSSAPSGPALTLQPPSVFLMCTPPYLGVGETLTCHSSATSATPGAGIVDYLWSFGDGGSATTQNAMHVYSTAGTFTVTLTVTDAQGQSASQSTTVTVIAGP